MLLEHDKYDVTITKIEDAVDWQGVEYLKCRGSRGYKYINKNGKKAPAYDTFSSVSLYGDRELLDMTKERLFAFDVPYPRLKLHLIVADISLNYHKPTGKIYSNLKVLQYDFVKNKYQTKSKNKKKLKQKPIEEVSEFIIE